MTTNLYLISYLVFVLSMFIYACTRAYYETWIESILPRKDYKVGDLLIATKCGPRGDRSYILRPIRILGIFDYHITYHTEDYEDTFYIKHFGKYGKPDRMLLTDAKVWEFVAYKDVLREDIPQETNKHIGSNFDDFLKEEGIETELRLCCGEEPAIKTVWEYDEGRGYYVECNICHNKTAPYPDILLAKDAWEDKIIL